MIARAFVSDCSGVPGGEPWERCGGAERATEDGGGGGPRRWRFGRTYVDDVELGSTYTDSGREAGTLRA